MKQISDSVFCDDLFERCEVQTRLLPNPYRDLPYLVIKNFFDTAMCRLVAQVACEDEDAEAAMVKTSVVKGVVQPSLDTTIRKTVIHALPEHYRTIYLERFALVQPQIERFFNVALTTMTDIQMLEYTRGCFYVKHADDSSELVDAEGHTACFVPVAPERKITTVLFATAWDAEHGDTHHFTGGELVFNYLYNEQGGIVTLRPEAGDMIVFPSNPFYTHEVRTVTSGTRITLVQWHNAIVH